MTIRQFLSVVEIRTKIVSVSTFLISVLYVFLQGYSPAALHIILLFLSVLCVDMGTTAFNTFFDFEKGVDRAGLNRETEKVLVHEAVPPGAALLSAIGLFVIAGLIGIYFIITRGWAVLILGLASLLTGIFYSGGKHPISHSPFGEMFAGGFLGTVLFVVIQYVLSPSGTGNWGLWILLSLPSALLIASILTVNNTCDLEADKIAGRKTLSIRVGRENSVWIIGMLILGAFIAASVLALNTAGALHPLSAVFPAIFLLPALSKFRQMIKGGMVQNRKGPSMGGISTIFILLTLSIIGAQIFSLILSYL